MAAWIKLKNQNYMNLDLATDLIVTSVKEGVWDVKAFIDTSGPYVIESFDDKKKAEVYLKKLLMTNNQLIN